jgi:hypothetical protein
MKINYFISTLVICVLGYIYITFIYNVDFFSIFFRYNTLFTDAISNIPLSVDVIFSVFLRPDEHLQNLDVRLQIVCSLLQGSYIHLIANRSPNWN